MPVRKVYPSDCAELKSPVNNAVVSLAVETASAGYGALAFCGGYQGCQSTAQVISEAIPICFGTDSSILDKRKDILSDLRSLVIGLDETLSRTIIRRVAFHHATLTVEERDIVADAYD
ncbi:hypothetical protein MMC21_000339 [Puttea exsequens]|nr:hypothetical protein [Puttea exsequens]